MDIFLETMMESDRSRSDASGTVPIKPEAPRSSPAPEAALPPALSTQSSEEAARFACGPSDLLSLPIPSSVQKFESAESQFQGLFDEPEAGNEYPLPARIIRNADHLKLAHLSACFDIFHRCRTAVNPGATRQWTRQKIQEFLRLVFLGWNSEMPVEPTRLKLEITARASEVASTVCAASPAHRQIHQCMSSDDCKADVTVVASYGNNPQILTIEYRYNASNPSNVKRENPCPAATTRILQSVTDCKKSLRRTLRDSIRTKICEHNVHLAIRKVRGLVVEWARGSMSTGGDAGSMGFIGMEAVDAVLDVLEG